MQPAVTGAFRLYDLAVLSLERTKVTRPAIESLWSLRSLKTVLLDAQPIRRPDAEAGRTQDRDRR